MKKRFILTTLLLAALFALCMSAYATDDDLWVGGVGMADGDYLANGATTTSTTQPSGGYAYYKNGTLTLNGYDNGGEAYKYTNYYGNSYTAIYSKLASLKIVLVGNNSLKCTVNTTAYTNANGICTDGDVSISGSGTVNITVTATSTDATADTIARGIRATGIISISGGRVDITATASASGSNVVGAVGAYGIDGDVNITGGMVNITASASGSNVVGASGIYTNDASISGGTVDITATSNNGIAYGINASPAPFANTYGTISISGGRVDITATATASGSNTPYAYGLSANNVSISGGTVDITASASGSNNSSAYGIFANDYSNASGTISVSGGTVDITATASASGSNNSKAYGIFANDYATASGTISITGGVTTIDAGTQAFNKAPTLTNTMDYLMGNGFTDQFVVIGAKSLQHKHSFSDDYAFDATHHWHPCTVDGCWLPNEGAYYAALDDPNADYGAHNPSDDCATCGYTTTADVWVGGMPLQDGQYVSNDGIVTPVKPTGGYAYLSEDGKTLTLNGYDNDGAVRDWYDDDAAIYSNVELTIELVGKNKLSSSKHGIFADDNLAITGDGSLESDANNLGIRAVTLTIRDGKIDINSGNWGIVSEDYGVTIEDSDVTINSDSYGIYAESGEGDVTISGGTVKINTESGEGIRNDDRDVIISGATVAITTGGSIGISAGAGVTISDSTVNITADGNGIKADGAVTISGGYGTIVGEIQALKIGVIDDGVLTIGDRMEVLGSTDENGSGAKPYVESKRRDYQYIWFAPATSSPADPDDPTTPADPTVPTITNPIPENATVSEDGTVTVPAEGGSVSYPATFGAGETVTVTVTPDEHEKIASVVINGVEMGTSGVYVIENVTEALDIEVIFVKAQSFIDAAQGQEPSEPAVPAYAGSALRFYDVMPYNSAYDAINFVADRGIMNGTGVGEFSPEAALTRSMMATILWRMEGEPTVWYGGQFSDVKGGQWYSTPIAWANAAGIVEGYGNGVFGLNDSLTHGQLCAMLYRWNTRSYGDIATAWAWAQANGLYDDLAGVSADEAATRAGIAQVLMAFVTRVW
ncbi:MAG: carbohydrate-binding domain-containing protein [Ruminococcaceae bacterium]|nr:carbohydrate-binding domain-containing protein [Oscillospiraceae bacterium]